MMQRSHSDSLEAARTAMAVFCLLDRADAPMHELFQGLASQENLQGLMRQLRHGDRNHRAHVLASYLVPVAVHLNLWSLG